jgi:predicted extracellular nuclease
MRVTTAQSLTVSDNFNLARFGELVLSNGRLFQPTQTDIPGAPALAVADANARNQIILDDGSNSQNPDFIPYLDASNTRRSGDTADPLTAVLDYRFSAYRLPPTAYRLQPLGSVPFTNTNPRPQPPTGWRPTRRAAAIWTS